MLIVICSLSVCVAYRFEQLFIVDLKSNILTMFLITPCLYAVRIRSGIAVKSGERELLKLVRV